MTFNEIHISLFPIPGYSEPDDSYLFFVFFVLNFASASWNGRHYLFLDFKYISYWIKDSQICQFNSYLSFRFFKIIIQVLLNSLNSIFYLQISWNI